MQKRAVRASAACLAARRRRASGSAGGEGGETADTPTHSQGHASTGPTTADSAPSTTHTSRVPTSSAASCSSGPWARGAATPSVRQRQRPGAATDTRAPTNGKAPSSTSIAVYVK